MAFQSVDLENKFGEKNPLFFRFRFFYSFQSQAKHHRHHHHSNSNQRNRRFRCIGDLSDLLRFFFLQTCFLPLLVACRMPLRLWALVLARLATRRWWSPAPAMLTPPVQRCLLPALSRAWPLSWSCRRLPATLVLATVLAGCHRWPSSRRAVASAVVKVGKVKKMKSVHGTKAPHTSASDNAPNRAAQR